MCTSVLFGSRWHCFVLDRIATVIKISRQNFVLLPPQDVPSAETIHHLRLVTSTKPSFHCDSERTNGSLHRFAAFHFYYTVTPQRAISAFIVMQLEPFIY